MINKARQISELEGIDRVKAVVLSVVVIEIEQISRVSTVGFVLSDQLADILDDVSSDGDRLDRFDAPAPVLCLEETQRRRSLLLSQPVDATHAARAQIAAFDDLLRNVETRQDSSIRLVNFIRESLLHELRTAVGFLGAAALALAAGDGRVFDDVEIVGQIIFCDVLELGRLVKVLQVLELDFHLLLFSDRAMELVVLQSLHDLASEEDVLEREFLQLLLVSVAQRIQKMIKHLIDLELERIERKHLEHDCCFGQAAVSLANSFLQVLTHVREIDEDVSFQLPIFRVDELTEDGAVNEIVKRLVGVV